MVFHAQFKNTILISLLGHAVIFALFNFSFGNPMAMLHYSSISFLGELFTGRSLKGKQENINLPLGNVFTKMSCAFLTHKNAAQSPLPENYYLKPAEFLLSNNKITFVDKTKPLTLLAHRKESVLTFHPVLPNYFTLYFNDRQTVHIELLFNIISESGKNSIMIKRKISSGNLDVDLLVMRYIGHYLFIQQPRLQPNTQKTIKIDLTTKNTGD